MSVAPPGPCWLCGGQAHDLVQPSSVDGPLTARAFAITSADYGRTAAIWRCGACGFLACLDVGEVLAHYEALEDPEYDEGRDERSAQADDLLDVAGRLQRAGSKGRLLDVGAGTGTLVERALARGWDATGVEPSRWLARRATDRGLPVHRGVLPHDAVLPPFDVVMLVDVLEHVTDPVGLLRQARAHLAPGGLGIVVTPDVGSIASRVLGRRWWHRRIAHVGYFDRSTLRRALSEAGLLALAWQRPGWRFRVDYLVPRVHRYLPRFLHVRAPARLGRVRVPLNLLDSWLVAFTRAE